MLKSKDRIRPQSEQEKLVLLGQRTSTVSHELRNPLGVIKNAVYFLNMALEKPEPEIQETLKILEKEVDTSERLISNLLDFTHNKSPATQKVVLNDILHEALSHLTTPENINIANLLDKALPHILAEPDQLSQVFINIILNAFQAMH